MYKPTTRRLPQWLLLGAGLVLLAACGTPKEPYSVVEDDGASQSQTPIQANISEPEPRETIVYEPEHPETYIVQKGDTLWDISSHFLRDPWFWPEIWYKNPQVDNPHLIYPGDELAIVYVGGQKRLQVISRGETGKIVATQGLKIVKLSPRIRAQHIDASIPTIQVESIRQFLEKPLIIDEDELAESAYVLASRDNQLANSLNDTLYVRNLDTSEGNGRYNIFRPNKPLVDTVTGETLGYEALFVGEAKLERGGDPASLRVTSVTREVLRDDRILPISDLNVQRDFFPRPPEEEISGKIISLLDGISQVGQFQTVVINLGIRDDIRVGNVLEIIKEGAVVRDRFEEDPEFLVKLPDERAGIMMVVRAYDKMSFALIMEATDPIKLNATVKTP